MANTVIALKKSATPSSAPADLANGELAINYADGILYYKNVTGHIVSFSSGGYNFSTVNANNTLIVADTTNDILTIEAGQNIQIVGDAINDKITISASGESMDYPYANTIGAASNGWTNTVAVGANAWTNTVFGYSNTYAATVGAASNSWTNTAVAGANAWSNTKVSSVSGTAGEIYSTGGTTPTINLISTAVSPTTYGGASQIPVLTVDAFGRLTAASNVSVQGMDYAYANTIGAASNGWTNTVIAGANAWTNTVFGYANTRMDTNITSNTAGANGWTNTAVAGANAWTNTVVAGANAWSNTKVSSVTGTAGQIYSSGGTTPTINLISTAVSPTTYGNATIVPVLTVDAYGRITSAANVTISSSGGSGGGYYDGNRGPQNPSNYGDIFRVHSNTLTTNVTIYSGNNAIAAGPLTIATGQTLTIETGARSVIA